MVLIARNSETAEVVAFRGAFTFQTAYDFIAERDTDFDNPWMPDYEFILTDSQGKEYVFEGAAWFEAA
jgi:hypothetical protein